ncbi:hypothetical protein [Pantoea ananatis]|jgi:hypothetical protein|uniref:hypothetical protein n=1 Tax=Pantoea ananas TaxID=553 RepID=UPI001B314911|nr:hypothetical protein [Pantoea ananatis]
MKIFLRGARIHLSSTRHGRGRAVWLTRHAPAGMASAKAMLIQAGLYSVNMFGLHPDDLLCSRGAMCYADVPGLCDSMHARMKTVRLSKEKQHGE